MIEHPEGDRSRGWGKKQKKASEAKSDLTNALVEDLNVLTGW